MIGCRGVGSTIEVRDEYEYLSQKLGVFANRCCERALKQREVGSL